MPLISAVPSSSVGRGFIFLSPLGELAHLGVLEVEAAAVGAQVDDGGVFPVGGGGALESELVGNPTRRATPHLSCHVMSYAMLS